MTSPSLYWLRNDLRLTDNAALTAAAAQGPVIFLYVLDDQTPGDWRLGGASRWWLHKSLEALGAKAPLVLRQGAAEPGMMARQSRAPRCRQSWSQQPRRRCCCYSRPSG
jgi:deoxyribodipyrimidine photo-lyase